MAPLPGTPAAEALFAQLASPAGLTARAASFGRREVLQAIAARLPEGGTIGQIVALAEGFLASDHVVALAAPVGLRSSDVIRRADGRVVAVHVDEQRWTTPEMLATERAVIHTAIDRQHDRVGLARLDHIDAALVARPSLSHEQVRMVRQLTASGAGVDAVEGVAGSGKTSALAAAHDAWHASGQRVIGAALAARAAAQLEHEVEPRKREVGSVRSIPGRCQRCHASWWYGYTKCSPRRRRPLTWRQAGRNRDCRIFRARAETEQPHVSRGGKHEPSDPHARGWRGALTSRIRVDGKFFACGASRFEVRGVTYGTFRPRPDGLLFPDADQVKLDFSAISEAGFTVVRTYVEPSDDVLELAADWGLHLLAGVFWPDWRYLVGASHRQYRDVARAAATVVRRAARRLAGSEEVLALCIGNEVPADVVRWVGTRRVADLIAGLVDVVREEDPDRLVTYASYPSTEYLPLESLDFLTFNVFLERKADFRRYLTRLQHLAGERPLVIGECGLNAGHGSRGERAQAIALDWQLETALERGVAGTCVFSWTDEWAVGGNPIEDWHFGLTRADRSPRPALDVAQRWNGRAVADLLSSDEWPSISVVVCAYNAAATLDECLRHACDLDYPGIEVIVVDDGSSDETAVIAARYPEVRLISIPHGGLSVARNVGMRAARSEVVAYLDSDAYPTREWPYYLALGFDSRLVAGVGGPNVAPVTDPLGAQKVARAPGGPVHVLLSDDRAEHIPGCNMAFWRGVLEEVGGFAPIYTSAGDDVDVCWKVLDRGWEIGFHPAALVWHHPREGARTYFRQQRGYGRAEALVAARHPDRFNSVGRARWRGRIYGAHVRPLGRQRVYRGAYGAAAYQSVYRGGGSVLDLTHQVGIPLASALTLTAPLGLLAPLLVLPSICAALFLAALLCIDAVRVTPPTALRQGRACFRLHVGWLALGQPAVRAWGRARAVSTARRDLPRARPLVGPARRLRGGIVALPSVAPRPETAAAVVDVIRRARVAVLPPTGWEARDAGLSGSLLVTGDLVTSGYPEGLVQVRVRRGVRRVAVAVVTVVAVSCWLVLPVLGAIVVGAVLLDALWGAWRTGPRVRRAIVEAAEQP